MNVNPYYPLQILYPQESIHSQYRQLSNVTIRSQSPRRQPYNRQGRARWNGSSIVKRTKGSWNGLMRVMSKGSWNWPRSVMMMRGSLDGSTIVHWGRGCRHGPTMSGKGSLSRKKKKTCYFQCVVHTAGYSVHMKSGGYRSVVYTPGYSSGRETVDMGSVAGEAYRVVG